MVSAAAYALYNYTKSTPPATGIHSGDEENGHGNHTNYETSPIENEEKPLLSRNDKGRATLYTS